MGFLLLDEDVKIADSDIECDAMKIFMHSLRNPKDVKLSYKDIQIFMDFYRKKGLIKSGDSYLSVDILNEETAEVKTKKFMPSMLELVFKYGFAPKWLINAKKIENNG